MAFFRNRSHVAHFSERRCDAATSAPPRGIHEVLSGSCKESVAASRHKLDRNDRLRAVSPSPPDHRSYHSSWRQDLFSRMRCVRWSHERLVRGVRGSSRTVLRRISLHGRSRACVKACITIVLSLWTGDTFDPSTVYKRIPHLLLDSGDLP